MTLTATPRTRVGANPFTTGVPSPVVEPLVVIAAPVSDTPILDALMAAHAVGTFPTGPAARCALPITVESEARLWGQAMQTAVQTTLSGPCR